DTIVENQSEGFDKVFSSVDYSIANFAHVEDLTLTGNAINATGNSLNNRITGNELNNVLNGGEGNDYIRGEDGNDTLISSAGRDTLAGGKGDDTYLINNTGNIITESSNSGNDTVKATIDYSISSISHVENLVLTDTANQGTGNYRNNQITGNDQDNTLNGSSGNDTLDGGNGNDSLIGGSGNDNLDGSAGDDTLNGGTGNDTLNGGTGDDSLIGGTGNDTYIVDSHNDTIVENSSSGGTDTVEALISYSIANSNTSFVENLILTGNAINGTGNSRYNQITGNALDNSLDGGNGNDTLDGSAGNDTLIGGTGSDTYIVDSADDTIVENQSEGFDKVFSSVDYSITNFAHVEDLTLTGNAINATGNSLNNRITGNELNNVLNGGEGNDYIRGEDGNDTLISSAGRDTLAGGKGDDTYLINNTGNIITESSNSGNDTVKATIDYSISSISHVENLVLTDTANQGTGNSGNNQITGNAQDNTLNGGYGNDTLDGSTGNDSLIGSYGNDILLGGDGNDTLNGGSNNDILVGGIGNDELIGSSGKDIFVLNNPDEGIDEITDFSAVDDTIHISASGFGGGLTAGGTISEDQILIGSSLFSADSATQRFIYDTNSGTLLFDADGNQTGFDAVQIARLLSKPTITASDIFVTV
ncbi:MAG: calcium-binding protein, partial [Cyanobacteria bacterium J06633_8]